LQAECDTPPPPKKKQRRGEERTKAMNLNNASEKPIKIRQHKIEATHEKEYEGNYKVEMLK